VADALGVPEDDVLRALGGGWKPFELQVGEWPATRWSRARWWVTGGPLQVLVGIAGASLVLARPDALTYEHRTLEEVVAVIASATDAAWIDDVSARHLAASGRDGAGRSVPG
jgi:hypothetical protein